MTACSALETSEAGWAASGVARAVDVGGAAAGGRSVGCAGAMTTVGWAATGGRGGAVVGAGTRVGVTEARVAVGGTGEAVGVGLAIS